MAGANIQSKLSVVLLASFMSNNSHELGQKKKEKYVLEPALKFPEIEQNRLVPRLPHSGM